MSAEQVPFALGFPAAEAGQPIGASPGTVASDDRTRDAELVRRTLVALTPRLDQVIARFYATLFAYAPGLRELFPISMQAQRGRLARVLNHVVGALDRPDDLAPFLAQLGRDHRKFAVLDEHYMAFGHALLMTLAAEAGELWTQEVANAWARTYRFMAETMITAARAEASPASWAGEVIEHRRLDRDTAVVWVRTDPSLTYRPGQYLSVETPHRPRVWRHYTPTTAPRPDGVIELLVKAVGSAGVSRAIVSSTRPGDHWRLGPPLGRLPDQISLERELLMIGGGTGIAPVQAILHGMELAGQAPPGVTVYYGARDWDSLHALDNLRAMSYRNRWLNLVPVVEVAPSVAGPEVGQLFEVVTRDGAWRDRDVLVSGSPAMLRATVGALLHAGAPLERVFYDPFIDD